ncbi:MAG: hypothetical protein WCL23_02060 [Candidatus Moraniibacteriota bacterium]
MYRKQGLTDGAAVTITLEHRPGTERVVVMTEGDASVGFAHWVVEEVNEFFKRHGMKKFSIYDMRVNSVENGAAMVFEITVLNGDLPKKPEDPAHDDPFWNEFHDTTVEMETVYRKNCYGSE